MGHLISDTHIDHPNALTAAFIQHGGALKLNQAGPALGRLRAPLYAKQEDKWDILSSFGRKPRDLDEEGIVSAWDK